MAFNGIVMRGLLSELRRELLNGRIAKIAQPEKEELLLTVKGEHGQKRLLISANASLPLLYLTDENKTAPLTAPNFCMLLRKHIGSGRITDISQPGLERVLTFTVEHLNELGDPAKKYLHVEIMGKHSNIIFCDENNMILDAIKHIGANVSSVREVLPGRTYFIPAQEGKSDALSVSREEFMELFQKSMPLSRFFPAHFTGFSSVTTNELCYLSGQIDSDDSTASLSDSAKDRLFAAFTGLRDRLLREDFSPVMIVEKSNGKPLEFSCLPLSHYSDQQSVPYEDLSTLLRDYYAEKNKYTNMHQRSTDLRKNVQTILERNVKKLSIQEKQLKDTRKMDDLKLRGELLQAYAHSLPSGEKSATVLNYYTNEEITIPMDPQLSPMENANKNFEKYGKLKRTRENVTVQIEETKAVISHLQSIETAIGFAENEADLAMLRKEMTEAGFLRAHGGKKQKLQQKSKPLHFITEEGFHIYVGKNNFQNDELTFKVATGNDWWFHVKTMTGSHVIVKTEGKELPDHVFEDAAALAGYYSSGRDSDKVEIDYIQKKEVKKPNGANPGYVIYYTNYSMTVKPGIFRMKEISD